MRPLSSNGSTKAQKIIEQMKTNSIMKRVMHLFLVTLLAWSASYTWCTAQEDSLMISVPENKPVKNTFNSIWLIDDQSVMVPIKGTFEFDLQHRFGLINSGEQDMAGLFAPSNIRLGFEYVVMNKLMVGFGITKLNLTWDVNAKYALWKQMQNGGMPVSVTYYGNAAFDTRSKDYFTNPDAIETLDRISFFHQIIIARKFSDRLSVQVAPSLSHFNTVEAFKDDEGQTIDKYNNDHFAVAIGARYKISPVTNLLINFDQPISTHEVQDPQSNLSFGIEINTSAHQFQFFLTNFYNITPQRNNLFNTNSPGDGEFLLGFNMTRLWN
jgi:hypothetical protein